MVTYVDSSVILRTILGQAEQLREWPMISRAVTSAIAEVECLRSLDRLRLTQSLSDRTLAEARTEVFTIIKKAEVVDISQPILARASLPLPTALKTLDAIHLATAQMWREQKQEDLIFATHDVRQAAAARSVGFTILGT